MPKSLIVFFSQGGTTSRIAKYIAEGLRATKCEVHLHDIKDGQPPDPRKYDILGIGSPTYYFRPPFNVIEYLNGLPDLAGKPFFVFVLHGTYCGDSGNIIRRALEHKGAREIGYSRCLGADYFLGYLKQGYLFSPHHPEAKEVAQAEIFGREVAAHHSGKPYVKPEYDASPSIIYRFERLLVNRFMIKQMYSRLIWVNAKKCSACGLCMKLCPTRNISADKEGRPIWGRNCLLCFTCEMKCPLNAINSPITWRLFWPFMVYNTLHASHDPSIDYVKVLHRSGHTKVM
jgi:flavodoxin/Pyruvate/2-oxoacid:ferredoxin oxidoreductase delta subunit